jgi:hypothetical protein
LNLAKLRTIIGRISSSGCGTRSNMELGKVRWEEVGEAVGRI